MSAVSGQRPLLARLLLALHLALAAAVALTIVDFALAPGPRAVLILLALLPLALSLYGLIAGRTSTLRWLALALVLYAGLGSVEVIAAGSWPAVGLLLFALLELAGALIWLRHPPPQ